MLRIRGGKHKCVLVGASCLAAIACTPSADAVNSLQNEQARGDGADEWARARADARSGKDEKVDRSEPFVLARHSGGLSGGRLTRLSGELMLRGTCLTLRSRQGEYALIWPRDAAVGGESDGNWSVELATPQGRRSLAPGDRLTVGGYGGARSAVEGTHIVDKPGPDCPDKAWIVQGLP